MKTTVTLLILVVSLATFSSCKSESTHGSSSSSCKSIEEKNCNEIVSLLNYPFRENGFADLETIVLSSSEERDSLIQSITTPNGWNDVESFTTALSSNNIDFETENVILYTHTEGSGSIKIDVQEPTLDDDGAYITIIKTVPPMMTMDMAYYSIGVVISKTIPKLVVTIDDEVTTIINE